MRIHGLSLLLMLAGMTGLLLLAPTDAQSARSIPAAREALPKSAAPSEASTIYLPVVARAPIPVPSALVIDHTTTDLSRIPLAWIDQAKTQFKMSYGHTSHGSQLITGITFLRIGFPSFDFTTNGSIVAGKLSIADYTPTGDLGNPDRVTWASRTRTYLNGTGSNRNVVMWSWCGQVSTATAANIDTYLSLMNQLEIDYPGVKFVYMTGHLDGTGASGNLFLRNNQIRDYVRANNKILFDFADIESYDPAGGAHFSDTDACSWCTTWCNQHPADCANFASMGSCAHSHKLNCKLKGQAFWWLMARLAGWNGL